MKIAININGQRIKYIREALKDEGLNVDKKNVSRVLKELKDIFIADFDTSVDDAIMYIKQRKDEKGA